MDSAIKKLSSKLDKSRAMHKHREKPGILKKKGPHIGLYAKANNRNIWICWVTKSEQRLLRNFGIRVQ